MPPKGRKVQRYHRAITASERRWTKVLRTMMLSATAAVLKVLFNKRHMQFQVTKELNRILSGKKIKNRLLLNCRPTGDHGYCQPL